MAIEKSRKDRENVDDLRSSANRARMKNHLKQQKRLEKEAKKLGVTVDELLKFYK